MQECFNYYLLIFDSEIKLIRLSCKQKDFAPTVKLLSDSGRSSSTKQIAQAKLIRASKSSLCFSRRCLFSYIYCLIISNYINLAKNGSQQIFPATDRNQFQIYLLIFCFPGQQRQRQLNFQQLEYISSQPLKAWNRYTELSQGTHNKFSQIPILPFLLAPLLH